MTCQNYWRGIGYSRVWEDDLYFYGIDKPNGVTHKILKSAVCPAENGLVTVHINIVGGGKVYASGGDNAYMERALISVPPGYSVYFEAIPAQGQQFQKFVSADGAETTQNPFVTTVMTSGSITAYFTGVGSSGTVRKRLVTNLTDNEELIKAALFVTGGIEQPTFIRKYPVADGTAFEFEFRNLNYVSFGAGAGLGTFLAQNWKTIAALFLTIFGFVLIWRWESIESAQVEYKADLEKNTYDAIDTILRDPTMTNEQKQAALEGLLKAFKPEDKTNWGGIVIGLGLAAIGAAVLSNYIGGKR